jgi:hypothetical protein
LFPRGRASKSTSSLVISWLGWWRDVWVGGWALVPFVGNRAASD